MVNNKTHFLHLTIKNNVKVQITNHSKFNCTLETNVIVYYHTNYKNTHPSLQSKSGAITYEPHVLHLSLIHI